MYGRKIYEFALSNVPKAMACCLEKVEFQLKKVKKVLIHQANEKMDEAIIHRFSNNTNKIHQKASCQ